MVPKPYTAVCPASLFNISRLVSCKNRQINRTRPVEDKKRERPTEPERSCHYSLSVEDRSESRPTGRNGLRTACDVSSMPRAEHRVPCRPSHSAPAKRIVGRPRRKNRSTESSSVPRIRRASVADRGRKTGRRRPSAAFPSFQSHERAGDGPHGTQRDPRHEVPVAKGVYSSLPIAATAFCTVAMKRSASAAPTTRPTSSPFSSRIRKVG